MLWFMYLSPYFAIIAILPERLLACTSCDITCMRFSIELVVNARGHSISRRARACPAWCRIFDTKVCHIRAAYAASFWGGVHAAGELAYLASQNMLDVIFVFPDKGKGNWMDGRSDNLTFIFGFLLFVLLLFHTVYGFFRHRACPSLQISGVYTAVLLWWFCSLQQLIGGRLSFSLHLLLHALLQHKQFASHHHQA